MGRAGPATRRAAAMAAPLAVLLLGIAFAAGSTWLPLVGSEHARAQYPDFQILYAAGQGLAAGLDVHDPHVLDALGRRVGREHTPFCAYNPLVVRAFGLFGDDYHAAYRTWLGVNAALLAVAAGLLVSVLRRAGLSTALAATVALAALLLDDATWMSLFYNQMNELTLVAIVGALWAAQRERQVAEGALLAIAVCAKTSPLLLVVVAALAGRWRAVAAAAVTGAVLFGVSVAWSGWAVHASYVTDVLPSLGYAPALPAGLAFENSKSAWNLAPNGLVTRAFVMADTGRGVPDVGGAARWAWVATALVLAVLVRGVWRLRREGGDALGRYGLAVAAMFLVSSVTWPHHLVLAAVPVAALARRAWGRSLGAVHAALGAAATFVLFAPLYTFAPGPGRGAITEGVTRTAEERDMRLRTVALVALLLASAGGPAGAAAARAGAARGAPSPHRGIG